MKLHFVSRSYAVPLAYQALRQGCNVTAYLPDLPCGEGLIPIIPTAKPNGAHDAILIDGIGWGKLADELIRDGQRVLFGGAWAELVALKPEFNRAMLDKAGLSVAEHGNLPYDLVVGGWYEGGYRAPYYVGVLRNHLLAGDVGAPGGLVAAEVAPLAEESPLIEQFLAPLEVALSGINYRGPLSVSVVSTPDGIAAAHLMAGVHPLIVECLAEMNYGGLGGLLSGEEQAEPSNDCAVALALTLPPWPYGIAKPREPLYLDVGEGQAKHFWPLDLKMTDGRMEYTAAFGIIGSITARGRPRTEMKEHAWFDQAGYRARTMASHFAIPYLQYRNDVGRSTMVSLAPLL